MSNLSQYSNTVLASRAGDIEESNGFDVMPAGEYVLRLIEGNVKNTKLNDGKYLECVFEVCEENGSFVGRKIWGRFNFENKSKQASDIGIGQLKAFCRVSRGEIVANEQFTMSHVEQGLGVPFVGKLKVTKDTNPKNNEELINNEIASFVSAFDAMNATPQQGHVNNHQPQSFIQQQQQQVNNNQQQPFAQQPMQNNNNNNNGFNQPS